MLIGANSRIVSQSVDAKLKEINKTLPVDIEVQPVLNRTKLVNATIHTVSKNLGEGAILVIAILLIFLGYFRAALIAALVIPLAMLMTAIGMVQTRISGNLMSLGAIDFGLIVDGAIIITENCLRRLTQKQHELGRLLNIQERRDEVFQASREMIQPSCFGQAIIITVYIPILALTGVEGKMFHPMAMTVIFALLSAFVLSMTFIPAMIALFVKGKLKEKENALVSKIKGPYQRILEKALKAPRFAAIIACSLIIISFSFSTAWVRNLFPSSMRKIAMHAMRIPSTSLTQSTAMQMEVEKTLLTEFPEVDYVFSKTGTAEMASDPMPPNVSDTFIMLKPNEKWPNPSLTKEQLIKNIEEALNKLPGNNYEFTQPIEMRFNELISGVRSDLAIKVYGDNFLKMQKTAENIAALLSTLPGAADVKVEQIDGLPLLEVKMDRDTMSRVGLNVSDALNVVSIATGGGNAGQIFEGDRRFDLIVKLPEEVRQNLAALQTLPIPLPLNSKSDMPYIQLHQIASLSISEGLNEISRENGSALFPCRQMSEGQTLDHLLKMPGRKLTVKSPSRMAIGSPGEDNLKILSPQGTDYSWSFRFVSP